VSPIQLRGIPLCDPDACVVVDCARKMNSRTTLYARPRLLRGRMIAVHERALFEYLTLELSPAFAGNSFIWPAAGFVDTKTGSLDRPQPDRQVPPII